MAERYRIPVTDDESIAAVVHRVGAPRWLVFCHGFLSDKSGSYERRCLRAVDEGYNAVRFDFRGCGESDGAFVDQSLGDKVADLEAVVGRLDPESLALFGSSFGGKVAFHAAADGRLDADAIAARAPVTWNAAFDGYRSAVESDGERRFDDGRAIDRRFFDDLDRYPFADATAALDDVPVAIFHGRDDGSVPIEHSFDAAAAFESDVLFEAYASEGHVFGEAAERRLLDRLFSWLDTV